MEDDELKGIYSIIDGLAFMHNLKQTLSKGAFQIVAIKRLIRMV